MKRVIGIFSGLWKMYVLIILSLSLVVLYPLYVIFLNKPTNYTLAFKLLKIQTFFITVFSGIIVIIVGKTNLKKIGSCVITPNHTSYLDILVLYRVIPDYFIFMGKHTLKTIPLFNIFFKNMNIAINRKSSASAKTALERCAKELQKGNKVVLFPEGTIPDDTPNLLKFKSGAFKLAIDNQVPVVPITFMSNYKRAALGGLFKTKGGPGISKIIINEPISTQGMTQEDLLPLQEKVYTIINNNLKNGN